MLFSQLALKRIKAKGENEMSILTVNQVTHMYGDQLNFKDISFRLLPGEHAGLAGRNGAGKSTLLRILSQELLPDSGGVHWLPNVQLKTILGMINPLNGSVKMGAHVKPAYFAQEEAAFSFHSPLNGCEEQLPCLG